MALRELAGNVPLTNEGLIPYCFPMLTVDHLLTLIGPFCQARGISESRLSSLIFNDGKRVKLLRAGGDISSRKLVQTFQWFSDHWPEGAEWPQDVPRPASPQRTGAEPALLINGSSVQ